MDSGEKRDFVRTALIVVVFLAIALVVLNIFIGHAMDPPRPHP